MASKDGRTLGKAFDRQFWGQGVEERLEDRTDDLIRLIMKLRRRGVGSARVLSAFELMPRTSFVEEAFWADAFSDLPFPIGEGEVQEQPSLTAFVMEALSIGSSDKVLEVGTGSGYQTALLSCVAKRVYTVERKGRLLREARERFEGLDCANIVSLFADGTKGWPTHAPFDRIVVNAACLEVPPALVDQLAPGGRLVIPRYVSADEQHLILLEKTGFSVEETNCLPVHFTPLRTGLA